MCTTAVLLLFLSQYANRVCFNLDLSHTHPSKNNFFKKIITATGVGLVAKQPTDALASIPNKIFWGRKKKFKKKIKSWRGQTFTFNAQKRVFQAEN